MPEAHTVSGSRYVTSETACVWTAHGVKSRRPPSSSILLSYFQSLNNGPIEPVQLPLKAAVLPPTTVLLSYIDDHRLALRFYKGTNPRKTMSKEIEAIPSTSLGHRCPYMHFRSSQSLPNLQGVIRLTYLSVAISFLLGL